MSEKHVFALYCRQIVVGERVISDPTVVHRLVRVLRLRAGDELTLFGGGVQAQATVIALSDREVRVRVAALESVERLQPQVSVLLAVLRPEALQAAVASLTEVGVSRIVLYTSAKTQRSWGGAREYERLERIMIASAEQAKQFALPEVLEPRPLEQVIEAASGLRILCDPSGVLLAGYVQQNAAAQAYTLAIGPEGDFTAQEKAAFLDAGYQACRLTPTVLRSEQAAFLAAGILRSLR